MDKLRAAARMAASFCVVIPTLIAGALIQPVYSLITGDEKTIPNFMYNSLRSLLGYKIEFNRASAPIIKDRPVWYVANHLSNADFVVLGSKFDGVFAGKSDILQWKGVAPIARALKYIGIERTRDKNPQSRGQIAKNFNAGRNTIMFPEGTTSEGSQVYQFRKALPELLYGEPTKDKKNRDVVLQQEVLVQPVAIRIKEVDGKDATGNDSLRNLYSMQENPNFLSRMWQRFQIRSTTVELTVFPAMNPKDFANAEELMNAAAEKVASVVNPGQVGFERSHIPTRAMKK